MKLPISARLLACCDYIAPGDRVADIGCDHGLLIAALLEDGRCDYGIAADINPQPLKKARRELGWTPRRGLEDILADAWAWHSSHPHGYQD